MKLTQNMCLINEDEKGKESRHGLFSLEDLHNRLVSARLLHLFLFMNINRKRSNVSMFLQGCGDTIFLLV